LGLQVARFEQPHRPIELPRRVRHRVCWAVELGRRDSWKNENQAIPTSGGDGCPEPAERLVNIGDFSLPVSSNPSQL